MKCKNQPKFESGCHRCAIQSINMIYYLSYGILVTCGIVFGLIGAISSNTWKYDDTYAVPMVFYVFPPFSFSIIQQVHRVYDLGFLNICIQSILCIINLIFCIRHYFISNESVDQHESYVMYVTIGVSISLISQLSTWII